MAATENFATFEKFAGLATAGEFFGREEIVVDAVDFAGARRAGGGGNAKPQAVRVVGNQLAQNGRFADARGAGKDDQVANIWFDHRTVPAAGAVGGML